MRSIRPALLAFSLASVLYLTTSASAGKTPMSAEAAELSVAIQAWLSYSREGVQAEEARIPPGDYPLCSLKPALVYRNMINGRHIASPDTHAVYKGWDDYIAAVSTVLSATARASNVEDLALRAQLDRDVRSKIGEFGISEPTSVSMRHYQALLWAASCLIDRSNTEFIRAYLQSSGWPSTGNPQSPKSPSQNLFLLAQHSLLGEVERDKLMRTVEEAYRRRLIAPFDYARMVDRFSQSRTGHQKYGTQLSVLNGQKVIEGAEGCKEALNANRRALGLEPIATGVVVSTKVGETCNER